MTYIQLALYGVPAVVIRGDVLTLQEYDRWYTPAYLLGKWVWRAPQPFGTRMNESDERLKMLEEPMYAAFRLAEQFMRKGKLREITSNPDCGFVIWIGTKRLIKRKKFEKYLEDVDTL